MDDLSRVYVPSHWFSLLLLLAILVSVALAADVYTSATGIAGQTPSVLCFMSLLCISASLAIRQPQCEWLIVSTPRRPMSDTL